MSKQFAQKKQPFPTSGKADWHPADVVAALRKIGWSLRKLSQHHGYHPSALHIALHKPWPKGERLIAEAIGLASEDIWPARHAHRAQRSPGIKSTLSWQK